jgi:hypothetical protein
VAKFGDVAIDQPNLALANLGIALGNRALAKAQGLDLGPGKHNSRFESAFDIIIKLRPPVFCDDLGLVEWGVGRTGHVECACRDPWPPGKGGN